MRAISGEKTAFAYSDDISAVAALGDAATAVRAIAAAGQAQAPLVKQRAGHVLYVPHDPLASLPATEKGGNFLSAWRPMRAPRIRASRKVMAHIAGEYEVMLVAGSDSRLAADVRPLVQVSITVIVEGDAGKREQGLGERWRAYHLASLLVRFCVTMRTRPCIRR